MKAPNGYGGITKLSGRRRKPFVVRLTIGHNEKGYPIYKVLGYFKTRAEAMLALADYHKTPYNIDTKNITACEVFEEAARVNKRLSKRTMDTHKSVFNKHIKPKIGDVPYSTVNLSIMQGVVDSCEKPTAKMHTRDTFSFMDRYAMEHDIIIKSYSQFVELAQYQSQAARKVFTYEEIAKLWKMEKKGDIIAKTILLFLYTGFRRTELADMTTENIKDGCLVGGVKTKAGKNRIVPIHSKIRHIIEEFSKSDGYLLPRRSTSFFGKAFTSYCEKTLGTRHIPHECRHTFITELNRRKADQICLDRLVGHASGHVGHDIYTHKSVQELSAAIELISYK